MPISQYSYQFVCFFKNRPIVFICFALCDYYSGDVFTLLYFLDWDLEEGAYLCGLSNIFTAGI